MSWAGWLLGGPIGWLVETAVKEVTNSSSPVNNAPPAMKECTAQFGDIVGVKRQGGMYEHYGVFISNQSVIHYSSPNSDVGDNRIIETTFSKFLRGSESYFVLDFDADLYTPAKVAGRPAGVVSSPLPAVKGVTTKSLRQHFSPRETVNRARSRMGEDNYHLALNNCEHFAIWCKTGVSESAQIDKLLETTKKHLGLLHI